MDRKNKFYYTIVGLLNAARFLQDSYDEPTMAANMLRSEVIEGGLCSTGEMIKIAKKEGIEIRTVLSESVIPSI